MARKGVQAGAVALLLLVPLGAVLAQARPGGGRPAGRTRPSAGMPAPAAHSPILGVPAAEVRRLEARFADEVWPLLSRAEGGCLGCHRPGSATQLHFPAGGAAAAFRRLLAGGFLEPESSSGLLARVAAPAPAQRMPPPPAAPWSDSEVAVLRGFTTDLYAILHASDARLDEQFPPELREPFTGKPAPSAPDNTFLSYTQLRGKIRVLFGEEWQRAERDLFAENLAQFGGADFQRRFDESTRASASYLAALDALARDVASRAYLTRSGPFAGRPAELPAPRASGPPDPRTRAEIVHLYRYLLYRAPTEAEVQHAHEFLRRVYTARRDGDDDAVLDFELEVADPEGRVTRRAVRLPVDGGKLGLGQSWINQALGTGEARAELPGEYTLSPPGPGDPTAGPRLELRNDQTTGTVGLAAVEVTGPLPASTVQRIPVTDPRVVLEGAWQRRAAGEQVAFEDGDAHKGGSRIVVPLRVESPGKYRLAITWLRAEAPPPGMRGRRRRPADNAESVPVFVYSHDPSRISPPPALPVPPPGEALFFVDQTMDTLASWDLRTAFRFGDDASHGVEIRNDGTRRRVVADAVHFHPASGTEGAFTLDDPQAEGGWPKFNFPSFRPYNLVGEGAVTDNNERKGELRLLYRPTKSPRFRVGDLYRPAVTFPGQADNDTRVPVVVRAAESTPIVQLSVPPRVVVGAEVTLDASHSYNLQRTPLRYQWRQNGGPRVRLSDARAARVSFTVEPTSPAQSAWEGLCRALMAHPDFLFTRPRSLAAGTGSALSPADRRRLLLVKLAQDLVGRPPIPEEVARVDRGESLASLAAAYLETEEFRRFYFHRIRLVLESRGTAEDDEPVRLWCHVAFTDRPFGEILTADYTVDPDGRVQPRPEYHGRTGLLTMKGFIRGKPGLPHFNYAAIVTEKFLGYVYEVPPSIVMMREGITAVATTAPGSACYSCHKILTPLAYQRLAWSDEGEYRPRTAEGAPVDDSDRGLVATYPYRGRGMEAFALQAVKKERFLRTMMQTHFVMLFGREMRYQSDERALYQRLWASSERHGHTIRPLLRALVTSPEYLNGGAPPSTPSPAPRRAARRR